MRTLFVLISLAGPGLYACQSNSHKNEQTQQNSLATTSDTVAEEHKNFFVITSWATTDRQKALAHIPNQQQRLMDMWNKGIVENIYYNPQGKFTDGKPLPLIGFVFKNLSEGQARQALDTAALVKSNLATYTLLPVGNSVFGRSERAMNFASKQGEVFVVMWALLAKKDSIPPTILDEQTKVVLKLQQEGVLENGYFDRKSRHISTAGIQPAIYFINAKSEADARKIIDAMPFVTSKQATYGLHNVGQFMAGIKK